MAHMKPAADHFAAYHVETNVGTEIVPEDVVERHGLNRFLRGLDHRRRP